jgi:UDP-N-acetylmuramate--alanine ligase
VTDGNYHIVYFLGIGGIGMSALARWFKQKGYSVFGYDRTSTVLTKKLEEIGIPIHYEDAVNSIDSSILSSKDQTLVVYTPALPIDHLEFNYLRDQGYSIKKRSEVLGDITENVFTVAVGGTHGKTTTSTMLAHMLKYAGKNVTAFLGGISTNYETNYIEGNLTDDDAICVVEADEYDRSFLCLHPDYTIVTAMDADHLDIYGKKESLQDSFIEFMKLVPQGGSRLINEKVSDASQIEGIRYGIDLGDTVAKNIRVGDGIFIFDFQSVDAKINDLTLYQPGYHNVENAVAAIQVCLDMGVSPDEIRNGLSEYKGVKRRFEYLIRTDSLVYVDDYAHHPVEIDAFLGSLKVLYPTKKLTAIFQPHLYTRTRDFVDGFADSLSTADKVFLLDIYPAREEPIPGVTSDLIYERMKSKEKQMTTKESLVGLLDIDDIEVLATIGAGDIDTLVGPIKTKLTQV